MSTQIQSWRTSFATVMGTSHQNQGSVCQDEGRCRIFLSNSGKEILLAVASDGAGSASKSHIGSTITVNLFMQEFGQLVVEDDVSNIDKTCILQWLEKVRNEIALEAEKADVNPKEFACTVLGAILGTDNSIFFQIGDGAIVVSKNESQEYSPIFLTLPLF